MKKIILFAALLMGMTAYAQQDPLFSQYMFNKLLLNPGYAGSKEVLSIDALDRFQWVGIEGAPRTFTFGAHTALPNNKVGVGLYAYRDVLGPTINQGLMGSYAYRILFPNSKLSFGLQFGFKSFVYDRSKVNTLEPDFTFDQAYVQRYTPDANFGIYYYSNKFFIGLSSKQLFQNEYGYVMVNGTSTYTRLMRHFYGMAGVAIPISEYVSLRPSFMAKFVKNAPLQLDANVSLVFNDQFWIGMSYRTEKAIIFLTEFRITEKLRVGYSFDMYLNELQPHNKGSHEIRLGLDIELFQSRMLTPRYFF
ncbi:MAG: type IX secretion system membrane protein PorP/SprF [Bacteroidales bacterium]|nr:type IX secretion system membrane protein PorP/SprF [Bacteroidales bacterium]